MGQELIDDSNLQMLLFIKQRKYVCIQFNVRSLISDARKVFGEVKTNKNHTLT